MSTRHPELTTSGDAIAFLFSLERLGMKFGLENIGRLSAAMGHPERAFRSVIVGGTNGKGSVTVMLETALRAAGRHVARYTSPHLVRFEERFVIDGREADLATIRESAERVRSSVDGLLARGALEAPPTFFECTTAVAFDLFRSASVDIAVLEVGLGGRLDATNVVTPLAAAITSIDLDHQVQLGNTIESIAREKAGIIKAGIPVVCGRLPPAADRVIQDVCAERGAAMVRAADNVHAAIRGSPVHPLVDLRSRRVSLDGVSMALSGRHQVDNAIVAVSLLDELADLGIDTSAAAVQEGLTGATWPARLERFAAGTRDVLLDAAHNPAGAEALASYLQEIGWRAVTLVFGVMCDKDAAGMLAALAPLCERIICTTAPNPRAMDAAALAAIARGVPGTGASVEALADPAAALERGLAVGSRIVAAGSIFLIGPLRDILRKAGP